LGLRLLKEPNSDTSRTLEGTFIQRHPKQQTNPLITNRMNDEEMRESEEIVEWGRGK
jgi:hypothetical protein